VRIAVKNSIATRKYLTRYGTNKNTALKYVLTRLGQVLEVEKKRAIQEDTIGIVNLINLEV